MHMFDGKRRAQVRTRLMRRLDQQLAALRATDSDIERVEQDAQQLIVFTDVLLAHPAALHSIRDPRQLYKVQRKLADLKAELATRAETKRALIRDILFWDNVPITHVLEIERVIGINRGWLRPDLYDLDGKPRKPFAPVPEPPRSTANTEPADEHRS